MGHSTAVSDQDGNCFYLFFYHTLKDFDGPIAISHCDICLFRGQ